MEVQVAQLLALMSPLVIPFVLVGVTVVGVAIYVLVKRHHRRTLRDSVNFGPDLNMMRKSCKKEDFGIPNIYINYLSFLVR